MRMMDRISKVKRGGAGAGVAGVAGIAGAAGAGGGNLASSGRIFLSLSLLELRQNRIEPLNTTKITTKKLLLNPSNQIEKS